MEDATIPEEDKGLFGRHAIYAHINSFTVPEGTILVCGVGATEVFELYEEINLVEDKDSLIKVAPGSSYQFVSGTPLRTNTPSHKLVYCRLPTAKELEQYRKLPTI